MIRSMRHGQAVRTVRRTMAADRRPAPWQAWRSRPVNEANKSFTVRFEGSSYPNNTGVEQTRPFTLTGDDLKIINPANTASGAQSELVYKRAK
jgi:hypothetical protein